MSRMRAMQLDRPRTSLRSVTRDVPVPGRGEILLRVSTCAVCRTDLHVVDGDLTEGLHPVIPGHEIVGNVAGRGAGAERFALGARVGVPWLGSTCGHCAYCTSGRENLCDTPQFTGYTRDGGYAEYTVADERFCFAIPDRFDDAHAAPLLCAGLIGFRALRIAGDARNIGLYGFGAAAHILAQIAVHQGRSVYAFTRRGDDDAAKLARSLGAIWAGDSETEPPVQLDAALIFAPVGTLVPSALRAVAKGGTVVCAGIHMSDIPTFPYSILWGERVVRSVANLTRRDGDDFFAIAREIPLRIEVQSYPLDDANRALDDLRDGRVHGAAVLRIGDSHTSSDKP